MSLLNSRLFIIKYEMRFFQSLPILKLTNAITVDLGLSKANFLGVKMAHQQRLLPVPTRTLFL